MKLINEYHIDALDLSELKRYLSFLQHYPELKEELPLREIASFIGVTPETVSKIRKRILLRQKS